MPRGRMSGVLIVEGVSSIIMCYDPTPRTILFQKSPLLEQNPPTVPFLMRLLSKLEMMDLMAGLHIIQPWRQSRPTGYLARRRNGNFPGPR